MNARIKNIFILEKPNTFNINKSLLFLILIINHILEIKIIKGKIFRSILGIKIKVSMNGVNILAFFDF